MNTVVAKIGSTGVPGPNQIQLLPTTQRMLGAHGG